MVTIKGHEFRDIKVRDSYSRRAQQYKNKIISALRVFRLDEDDIEIPMEQIAMKNVAASVTFYLWDEHLYYSYKGSNKFVENLAMVAQVIEYFVNLLNDEKISKEEFLKEFAEDGDILEQRIEARKVLGVEEDSIDFEDMHEKYKKLSKEHHPDMPNGDTERFKQINRAHKILKRELRD
ncbi:J domain-containing protein [Candidatus Woesearchaeota archaeon]|nr:J domain-containing protein [Candidatus Woesearchaeota archaeon]